MAPSPRTRTLALVSLAVALTTAGAFLRLPVGPVPFTLQTFFVLLSGAVLGPRAASMAMAIYVLAGLAGLPVFAGGGGPQYVLSPTFGFLLSFPLAAAVTGLLAGRPWAEGRAGCLVALLCGTAAVYAVGLPGLWLNLALVQGKELAPRALLGVGMLPFLPADLLKALAASWIVPPLRRSLKPPG